MKDIPSKRDTQMEEQRKKVEIVQMVVDAKKAAGNSTRKAKYKNKWGEEHTCSEADWNLYKTRPEMFTFIEWVNG